MGDADDIKKMIAGATRSWTRQRKAEERTPGAARYRFARMTPKKEISAKEAAARVMKEAYLEASANDTLPANARQIMYAARGKIQEMTGKPLNDQYFCQTLLPNYIDEHNLSWDVVYDDRGHFVEPHTGRSIGIGTLNVRGYLRQIREPYFLGAAIADASVGVLGPEANFGAVLFIEKEGFMSLFERTKLAQRYDLAIMSTKGVSVTAARQLVETICGTYGLPLFVLHDFDVAGFTILKTVHTDTRRYQFQQEFEVIDLGLRLADVETMGLESEDAAMSKSDKETISERLKDAGAQPDEIAFLLRKRVELNAMTSGRFVEFIEGKLDEHGVQKVIPGIDVLKKAYTMFAEGKEMKVALEKAKKTFKAKGTSTVIPKDLKKRVEDALAEEPSIPWHQAVQSIAEEGA